MQEINEGAATIFLDDEQTITRKDLIFYNPLMREYRDCSILFLRALDKKNLLIADALAGSGIRSFRILKELDDDMIKHIFVNDCKKEAIDAIKKNIEHNFEEKDHSKITLDQTDAKKFLLRYDGFDHIEIDPFGSPNPFLDSAISRAKHKGTLSINANDVSALSGTYIKTCQRRYHALPIHNYLKKEIALRIFIRKIQLVGMQYDKALIPSLSYSHKHYVVGFFRCFKSKTRCNELFSLHQYFLFCHACGNFIVNKENSRVCPCSSSFTAYGPLYSGSLCDVDFLGKMLKGCDEYIASSTKKLLKQLIDETKVGNQVGFYSSSALAKIHKKKKCKSLLEIQKALKEKGYSFSKTHFHSDGFKSDIAFSEVMDVLF